MPFGRMIAEEYSSYELSNLYPCGLTDWWDDICAYELSILYYHGSTDCVRIVHSMSRVIPILVGRMIARKYLSYESSNFYPCRLNNC